MSIDVEIEFTIKRIKGEPITKENDPKWADDIDETKLTITGDVELDEPSNFRGHPDNHHDGGGGWVEIEKVLITDSDFEEPWQGTLTSYEEDEIKEELRDQAKTDCAEAWGDAQIDACEDDY